MVTVHINGNPYNFFIDSMSGESFITATVAHELGLSVKPRKRPLVTKGFADNENVVDKIVNVCLSPGCVITFNVTETIGSTIGGVSGQIYKIWPGLKKYEDALAAPIPRPPSEIHFLVGIKDSHKFKTMGGHTLRTIASESAYDDTVEIQDTSFGLVVQAFVTTTIARPYNSPPVEKDDKEELDDIPVLINKETPLDQLLTHYFSTESFVELGRAGNGKDEEEMSDFNKLAKENFENNHRVLRQEDGTFRF